MCPGTADHGSENRQTVCPGTARSCVPAQPNPVSQHSQTVCRRTARPAPGCDAARNPSGHPCAAFPRDPRRGARGAHATARPRAAPTGKALPAPRTSSAPRSPPGPVPGPAPAPSSPPADSPAPPRGGRRAASSAQSSAQRPPPIARRHRQRQRPAPPPGLAPLRHREQGWQPHRTRRRTGSGPGSGTRSAPLRRARGPPASPLRPGPARLPAGEEPGSTGAAGPRALPRHCGATAEPGPQGPQGSYTPPGWGFTIVLGSRARAGQSFL